MPVAIWMSGTETAPSGGTARLWSMRASSWATSSSQRPEVDGDRLARQLQQLGGGPGRAPARAPRRRPGRRRRAARPPSMVARLTNDAAGSSGTPTAATTRAAMASRALGRAQGGDAVVGEPLLVQQVAAPGPQQRRGQRPRRSPRGRHEGDEEAPSSRRGALRRRPAPVQDRQEGRLVDDRHAGRLGLLQLASRVGARHHEGGRPADRAGRPCRRRRRPPAWPRRACSASRPPVMTTLSPVSGPSRARRRRVRLDRQAGGPQPLEQGAVGVDGEELAHRLGHHRPDPLGLGEQPRRRRPAGRRATGTTAAIASAVTSPTWRMPSA